MMNDVTQKVVQNFFKKEDQGTSTATLSFRKFEKWDEGYYTCRSGNKSARIYIFPDNRSGIHQSII